MAVLIIQSAYTLFEKQPSASDMSHIDIVIRTSMAGIFGYILSANFIRQPTHSKGTIAKAISLPSEAPLGPKNRIGFYAGGSSGEIATGESSVESPPQSSRLQIITATSIGLFCLVALILLRNFSADDISVASTSATITQFRDFVSGCIGFLIGSPTNGQNEK